jgi:acetyl/propionyl-CoA carboxylase alpha subunit
MTIRKLLVANRGEIAVRIFRTCQELGIHTVAVYSDADKDSLHMETADESVYIGGSEPSESYLSQDKILAAANQTGADAIHPGYGFLSERADFAEACKSSGFVFVGPTPESMRRLGDKISAKSLAVEVGVPIVPGYFQSGASFEQLADAADHVGYPVMLKAAAGGGGRGMRAVFALSELEASYGLAVKEALSAFGNGEMMLEKLILNPRHVEVQIAADAFGKVACLFERECSLQRRNQKMVEEAPAPAVQDGTVDWLGLRDAAIAIAEKAEHRNLGTVEFIVDPSSGEFYFLEVNTRLQVEHPVTEACTGLDLVALQIRLAQGERLNLPVGFLNGDRKAIQGHAVEVRVLAEDPALSFRPSVGKIVHWSVQERPGVRVDTGFRAGSVISERYDSLLAKVIAHGSDRAAALAKLRLALEEFHILGVSTNIGFLLDLLADPSVVAGDIHTGTLATFIESWTPPPIPEEIAALTELGSEMKASPSLSRDRNNYSAWSLNDSFRV